MSHSTEQDTSKGQATSQAPDSSLIDVMKTWEKLFKGIEVQLRSNADLIATDLKLSLKAIVLTLISILVLVGIGLVTWVTLLAGLAITMTTLGLHWGWSFLLILGLNLIIWKICKGILRNAIKSINLTATSQTLFNKGGEQT